MPFSLASGRVTSMAQATDRPPSEHLEVVAGGVGRPHGDDVGLAAYALAAMGELQHGVVGVDLRSADDVVALFTLTGGMPADLSAVKRRIADAKSELDELRADVDAFTSAVPPPWRLEREGTDYVEALVSYIDREPDPAWGDRIGYIAVKARSTLDQLMTQLVVDSGNDPTKSRSYFPIF